MHITGGGGYRTISMTECHHVKADGNTCRSAALRNESFCYFHLATRDRIRRQRIAAERKLPLQIPILEDEETIQLTITDVVNAMLTDRIDYKKAALALYALQTAAVNVKRAHFDNLSNNFKSYQPENDPSLPEIGQPNPETSPAPVESKPPASVLPGQLIPTIHARAEDVPRTGKSPRKPPQTAGDNQALVQSALKHLKRKSG